MHMSGILFFRTQNLAAISEFYRSTIGCSLWLDQEHCTILQHGNMLFGFCQGKPADTQGIITFFYSHRAEVDELYNRLQERAKAEPQENTTFNIYQFFATDPEGRTIEFQCFLHALEPHTPGTELLVTRRSVRQYRDDPVPSSVLNDIFTLCRYSPTSRNSQSYYYVIIEHKEQLNLLASMRGESSAPIGRAPMAVAVCSDPEVSGAYRDDACIAAYHFMLASWTHSVGTCWITGMDKKEVKDILSIPESHYVVMITPVGFPAEIPAPPQRRHVEDFIERC